MNGPSHFRASTSPAAWTAATSVVWSAEFTALSTISRDGTIIAPPIITHSSSGVIVSSTLFIRSSPTSTVELTTSSPVCRVVSAVSVQQDAKNASDSTPITVIYFVFINSIIKNKTHESYELSYAL